MKKVLRKITSMMLVLSMAMGFAVPAIAVEATEESPSQIVSTGGVTYYAADGSAGTADPLDQRCSIGWKLWNGAAVKDDLAIYDLMCVSSKSAKVVAN